METIDTVMIAFSDHLPVEQMKASFPLKKFVEGAMGYVPRYVEPEETCSPVIVYKFIQMQYEQSLPYISERRRIPKQISDSYYFSLGCFGVDLTSVDFEAECVFFDDHIVTINADDNVLGVIMTADDYEKLAEMVKAKEEK